MFTKQTPGVYINELPSPVTITGLPTWTPAFVGEAEKGELNQPVLVTGWSDYLAKFGYPCWRTMLAFNIKPFFQESGGLCYVVRIAEQTGSARAAAAATFSFTGTAVGGSPAPTATMTFSAASKGTWGNAFWISVAGPSPTLLNISVFVRAEDVEADSSSSSSSDVAPVLGDIDKALINNFIDINEIPVTSNDLSAYGLSKNEAVYVLERFNGVPYDQPTIDSRVNQVSSFLRINLAFVGGQFTVAVAQGCYPLNKEANLTDPTGDAPTSYTPGVDDYLDYEPALEALKKIEGISLLSMPDVSMTMAWNRAGTSSSSGYDADEVMALSFINDALADCPSPQNWFYVVDFPITESIGKIDNYQDVLDFKHATNGGNALSSPHGAGYWPFGIIPHPVNGSSFFPTTLSGAIIGLYANTDQTVGVHQPAAGVNYGALPYIASLDVDAPITDEVQNALYPQGINVVRTRVNYGICVWGGRTLSPDPAWTYLNVRRTIDYIEKSLVNGLQWAVFQDITRLLWEAVKREVTHFLIGIWKAGGLFGDTQSQAFRVTCDETNNSDDTISQGYLYVRVEVAVVHPGEFIVIEIAQKVPDAS